MNAAVGASTSGKPAVPVLGTGDKLCEAVESLIDKVIEIKRLEGEVCGLKAAIGPLARGGIRTKRAEVKYHGAKVMECFSRERMGESLVAYHGLSQAEVDRLVANSTEERRVVAHVAVKLRKAKR